MFTVIVVIVTICTVYVCMCMQYDNIVYLSLGVQ